MKRIGVSFRELRELLLEIGFSETAEEKGRTRFILPRLKTYLLFRPYNANELVSERDLLVVRRQLVDNGLIEESALERFLHRVPA